MSLNLKSTVSILALTLCFATPNAFSMDEITVQNNVNVENIFNQREMNQYVANYIPQELDRGAFEALRCGKFLIGSHETVINNIRCIVPGTVSGVAYIRGEQQTCNKEALPEFQKQQNIPQYGMAAEQYFSNYGGQLALDSLNKSRENKIKFEKMYLNKYENSCLILYLFLKVSV